jgi:hypothetical protein
MLFHRQLACYFFKNCISDFSIATRCNLNQFAPAPGETAEASPKKVKKQKKERKAAHGELS